MMYPEISVIVLTYNSDLQKTLNTLHSIMIQKEVTFEIIVADDGSGKNNYAQLKEYFYSKNFSDYELIIRDKNLGTVKNLFYAIQFAKGNIIKPISPGDYLFDDHVLYDFKDYMDKTETKIVFGDSFFYKKDGDNYIKINRKNPLYLRPYKLSNQKKIKHNYLVTRDPILGADLFYDKTVLIKYLNIIVDKVKYCEDSVLNLMVADYLKISYYNRVQLYYEVGEGVSSSSSEKWKKNIYDDNKAVFKILLTQKKISKFVYYKNFGNSKLLRIILILFLDCFNKLGITLYKLFNKKYNSLLSVEELKKIQQIIEL